jgi:hypothetical protein
MNGSHSGGDDGCSSSKQRLGVEGLGSSGRRHGLRQQWWLGLGISKGILGLGLYRVELLACGARIRSRCKLYRED